MTDQARLDVRHLDPTHGDPGDVPTISGDGSVVDWGPASGVSTIFVPMSTTVGGTPGVLFDSNGQIVMTEVPAP